MKTTIKTEDFNKVIDIFSDKIEYKGQVYTLSYNQLKDYINDPKSYDLFAASPDAEENLYKNLALYIINHLNTDTTKFINIDLDKDFPIVSGLFEIVKNVYLQKKDIYLELPEVGNNALLIQSKKLLPVNNPFETALQENIGENNIEQGTEERTEEDNSLETFEYATDIELSGKENKLLESDKIIDNNRFFWKSESLSSELGSSQSDYIIGKLLSSANSINYSKSTDEKNHLLDKEFYTILQNANQEFVQSEKFKLELLELNDDSINEILIYSHHPDIFKIDFTKKPFLDFLKNQIENKNFKLISKIFEHNLFAKERNSYEWMRERIEAKQRNAITVHHLPWYELVNHDNLIQHLISKYANKIDYSGRDSTFSLVSVYPYLTEENKVRKDIVEDMLERIITKEYSEKRVNEYVLAKMPVSLYEERYFLDKVAFGLDYPNLKKRLASHKIEPVLLSDKQYLIDSAHHLKISAIYAWMKNFIKPEEIDKQFIADLISANNRFYSKIIEEKSLKSFSNDEDLLFHAVKNGYDVSGLPDNFMKKLLLLNHNVQEEDIKVRYLIESSNFEPGHRLYKDKTSSKTYDDKYIKIDYIYINKRDSYSWYHDSNRLIAQGKIKNSEQVLEALDTIKRFVNRYNYQFKSNSFYNELPKELKNDKRIVDKIIDIKTDPFLFKDLHPTLQYNSELALKFIEMNPVNTPDVPVEFFNDVNFSLDFAKLLDNGHFHNKASFIPSFVTKFFDSQEIKENYHEKLQLYINYFSLKESTNKKEAKKERKNKL